MQKRPVNVYRPLIICEFYIFMLIRQRNLEGKDFAIAMPSAEFVFFTMVDEFEAGGGFAQGFGIATIVVSHHGCAGDFGQNLQWSTDFCPWGGADGGWINQ